MLVEVPEPKDRGLADLTADADGVSLLLDLEDLHDSSSSTNMSGSPVKSGVSIPAAQTFTWGWVGHCSQIIN